MFNLMRWGMEAGPLFMMRQLVGDSQLFEMGDNFSDEFQAEVMKRHSNQMEGITASKVEEVYEEMKEIERGES